MSEPVPTAIELLSHLRNAIGTGGAPGGKLQSGPSLGVATRLRLPEGVQQFPTCTAILFLCWTRPCRRRTGGLDQAVLD